MINYENIEDAICSLLCPKDLEGNELNSIYSATPLPENEGDYRRLFEKSRVYISSVGSDYGSDDSTLMVIQEETVIFEAIIRAKSRCGPTGIFAVIADIRAKLLGYKFAGCKRIVMIKSGYIDGGTQNDWNYMLSFSLRTNVVENQPEPIAPLAKNIEFQ